MATVKLTKNFINNIDINSIDKKIDYYDTEIKGLVLRVSPSGNKSYRLKYYVDRKPKIHTIGKHGGITLVQAKAEAQRLNSLVIQGLDINEEKKSKQIDNLSFKEYLDNFYIDWYRNNRKSYKSTINILKNTVKPLHKIKLEQIKPSIVNTFVTKYQKDRGCSNARINRIIVALKGAISRAVDFSYLEENTLSKLKTLRESSHTIRYLNDKETKRFFEYLEKQPKILKDIVTVAFYTGMRRNELFSLKWKNIDCHTNQITLAAKDTKTNKGRSIPIHEEVKKIFDSISKIEEYVFLSEKLGTRLTTIRSYWERFMKEAKIESFRFHDLRHNFCSMLVMKGVPIYTVAQLAGHADVKTTQIYAHLSPDVKKSAIDLL
ncbi:site-specific integrase [Francisella sp. SYW-9]|uniref:site-specific integrase n=1 Tax=Francisella sp. SYW-9 TaxID=2610888 RepID=UPI00123E3B3E|nr:site-specific integrase [Francisella sp. SYW-9]